MKAIRFILATIPALAATLAVADNPTPRLLGTSTPAAAAVPGPELTTLNAISDDARWLLFTSTSDRWVTNDLNAAADVFLFDRTASQFTLVSAALGGRSGNGASLAGGMSADASRVVFRSRASDLVATDTFRADWDVFVRDLATGTNWLVSVNVSSENAVFDSATPGSPTQISTDGRFVIFRSPLPARTPSPLLTIENVCRRDLAEARTECLTTNLPTTLNAWWRLTGFAATPDAEKLVVTASAAAGVSNLVAWKDLTSGQWVNCTAQLPPELVTGGRPTHSAPAISANGRFVAFRSEVSLAGSTNQLYGLTLYDTDQGKATLLSLRTNDTSRQIFPASAYNAVLSADGRYVAYSAPWPAGDPSPTTTPAGTNGPSQVYLYDAQTETTRLVSAAPDGAPADADASNALIAPDGRGVAFLSAAQNLVAGATNPALRAYWFDREAGTLQLIAELGEVSISDTSTVLSPNGDWLALSAPDDAGATTIHLFDTRTKTASTLRLVPQIGESVSTRGWIGVRPEGVSADGRYVALTAFLSAPAGDTNHMQVYLIDTQTGSRQLLSGGVDGNLANGHPRTPALSAGGEQVLFVSAATNLVTGDTNALDDVFLQSIATEQRRVLRADPVPASASAVDDAWLSPDGSAVLAGFYAKSLPFYRWYLANPNTGAFSAIIPGTLLNAPSFSRDGKHVALNLSAKTPETDARVEIHEPAAWLAAGGTAVPALWTSSAPAQMPVLSADGSRVAFFHPTTYPGPIGTNTLVVADWLRNEVVLSNLVLRGTLAPPALNSDGRFVVWTSPGSGNSALNQVWRADVDTGTAALVSVATDGASEADDNSKFASISADGRYVVFASLAGNLLPGVAKGVKNVFLRDMQTGQMLLLSHTPGGEPGTGWSTQPFFSADGNCLFFLSHAPDLAAGDYNQAVDLFKVEILSGDSNPLAVIRRNVTSGQVELLWNAQPGKRYRIDFKDDLGMATWQALPGAFTGETPVAVDAQGNPHRFFRVAEAP